ncbi:MAG: hypothetical protein H7Y20_02785 [Bryobacteraceae bacterium]|nr:hypothetical protein [Bryobacteraceae bacterium]
MKFVLFLWVVPMLAQPGVNFYTVQRELALGRHLASEIRRQSKPFVNAAVDAYVKRIGAALVRQLKEAAFEYQFEVISGGAWMEPFSLPGG